MGSEEQRLEGGWQTAVHRVGDEVRRSSGPQSTTVIALLRHLRDNGVRVAPQPLGSGFTSDGRERLRFIEGESPHPRSWSDEAMSAIGEMLRCVHDTASTFAPTAEPTWRPWFARSLPGVRPVIGHGDLGPWNILARNGRPVAFIDWDNAGPVDAHWELAQVGWLNTQLHDDDVAELNGLASPAERARQLRLLVDGYGLESFHRTALVDHMIEFAIRTVREEAMDHDVGPQAESPAADGFPVLWALAWRARAASWMLDHRSMLEAALA